MKVLVVAIDNSPVASSVLSLTIEQALALKASVKVLCCVDASYYAGSAPLELTVGEDIDDFGAALDEQNAAEQAVRRALTALQQAGIDASGRVVAGEAAETIVAQAKDLNAAMIIMGRRSLTPFNRLLKGSVSAAVIERARCPVLIDLRAE